MKSRYFDGDQSPEKATSDDVNVFTPDLSSFQIPPKQSMSTKAKDGIESGENPVTFDLSQLDTQTLQSRKHDVKKSLRKADKLAKKKKKKERKEKSKVTFFCVF